MSVFKYNVQTKSKVELVDITRDVQNAVAKAGLSEGICLVYIPHTTAGVTINEAADPAVVQDITKEINKIIPFHDNYKHLEGNSAAHIKSSLFGISTQIPVSGGKLTLGTWQGIYFCEFDGPRHRSFIVQLLG